MPPRRSSGRQSRGRLSADNNNHNTNNNNSSSSPLTESPATNGRVTRSRRSLESSVSSHKVAAAAASVGIGTGGVTTIVEEPTKTTRRTSARGRKSKDAAAQQDAAAMPPPPIPPPADVAPAIAPIPTPTPTSTSTSSQPSAPAAIAAEAAATTQESQQLQQQQPTPSTYDPRIKYIRSKGLRRAFARAIEKSTSGLTYDNFAKCFPTTSRYRPEVLQHVYNQVIPTWTERVNEELEHLCNEREIYTRLDELDRLIFEAKERQKALPPNATTIPQTPIGLSPFDLVTAHLVPLFNETEVSMVAELERVQRNVERLRKEKEETDKEMVQLGKTVENGLAVVQLTADAMRELGDLEEIEKEVDAMDEGAT